MTMNVANIAAPATPMMVSGASMQAPPQQKMTNLYNRIDTAGTGIITQAQFNQTFQTMNPPAAFQAAGANAVWSQLDPGGSGQVTQQDFVTRKKSLMVELRQGNAASSTSAAQTAMSATQALSGLGNQSVNLVA
jgi:hypothetical protein